MLEPLLIAWGRSVREKTKERVPLRLVVGVPGLRMVLPETQPGAGASHFEALFAGLERPIGLEQLGYVRHHDRKAALDRIDRYLETPTERGILVGHSHYFSRRCRLAERL